MVVDLSRASLVDHTFLERVHSLPREWPCAELSVQGLERLEPVSGHPLAARLSREPV